MGQYYYGVILDAKTRKPIMADYPLGGMKLAESGLWSMSRMVYELSKKGRAYKQRVTWAGDYSERKDYDGDNLWHYIQEHKIPETMGKEFKDDFEWYGAWSDCILSSEAMPPLNYKRIAPMFNAEKPLADDDPLLESPPAPPAIENTQTFADRLRAALQKNYGEAA